MPDKIVDIPGVGIVAFPSTMSDDEIGAAISKQTRATTAQPEPSWVDTAADVAIGAAKGLGNTAYGLGKLVHDYTPIGRISDAIQPGAFEPAAKPPELEPTNTPQRVGQTIEQIGEFFLPTGAAGKAAKAVEVGKAAALTMAQGGSPTSAGIAGALTAAIPGASAAKKAASAMETSAQAEIARALGATKEWAKSESAKLAPQILKRGIGGSREAMLDLAKRTAQRVGSDLNTAYQSAAAAGQSVPSDVIAGSVQLAKDALQTTNAAGRRVTIPGTEAVVGKLDDLANFVLSLGPDIPVDKAAHVKRTWDAIVSKAGLYGPKATASSTDSAHAWAVREAAGAFRNLLNTNPSIAALNQEAAFWTGLKNVLKETQKRTQAQAGTGLVQAGTGGAGMVVGAMSGDSVSDRATKAVLGGLAGRQLTKLLQSPGFRTQVSAPLKHALAEALASGSAMRIASMVPRLSAALPGVISRASQVAPEMRDQPERLKQGEGR